MLETYFFASRPFSHKASKKVLPQLTEKETEAQRGEVSCSSGEWADWNPGVWFQSSGLRHSLAVLHPPCLPTPEEGMATHSSILAWRIPWAEGLGELQSVGSQRVRHD